MTLTMSKFLETVDQHGIDTPEVLIGEGHHRKVIYTKAEKALRKGYTECGMVPDRPWLTDKGRAFLARDRNQEEHP